MIPYKHQEEIAAQAYPILVQNSMVCLSMEERTGKTLIALMLAEKSPHRNILILTKLKAISGWKEHLSQFKTTKNYTLINYHKITKLDIKPDLVIADECHYMLSGFPKKGKYMQLVRNAVYNCSAIFLSATFSAQSYSQLFHTFAITKHSPWDEFKSFYKWFEKYGIPEKVYVPGRTITSYKKTIPDLYKSVEHLFISYTRQELGFEHEPEDELHYIKMNEKTKEVYKALKADSIYEDIVADTPMGLAIALHQLEGGMLREIEFNQDKLQYILTHFKDTSDVVIMAHYVHEQKFLSNYFTNATVLSSTSFAEGVDLSHFKTLIVFSMSFSTSQYKQRRARQANMKRKEPIIVHYLLVRNGVSEAVYNSVALNGKNFVDRYYL